MDRRTDIPPLAIPVVSIARYANALVKSQQSLKLRILDYVFFYVFWNAASKNVKSRVFLDFQKNVKNVFSNYVLTLTVLLQFLA